MHLIVLEYMMKMEIYIKICSIKFTDKSKYSGLGDVEIGDIWDNVDWMCGILKMNLKQ